MRAYLLIWALVGWSWLTPAVLGQNTPAQNPPAKPPVATVAAKSTPWKEMDYGPVLASSIESPLPTRNMTQKGLAIRVNSGEEPPAYVLFDIDLLRYSAGWTGQLINWTNVLFDASHRTWPAIAGDAVFGNPLAPGWADESGRFDDPRPKFKVTDYNPLPADWRERGFGPLQESWGRFRGTYFHGPRVVLSYTVGGATVLDSPGMEGSGGLRLFSRTLNVGKSERDLTLQVLQVPEHSEVFVIGRGAKGSDAHGGVAVGMVGGTSSMSVQTVDGAVRLRIPAATSPVHFKLLIARVEPAQVSTFAEAVKASPAPLDLAGLTHGGPARYPQVLITKGNRGRDDGPYTIDTLVAPRDNPWKARVRFSGLDFFPDGRSAALCTWDGDVWLLSNIDDSLQNLTWRRIATGLHQPLGLKIVVTDSHIFVSCRDQIVRLRDLNDDGEIDFLECFNTDHQVTEHFHEFAMGLQTDAEGNFYYAKSARHALDAVVPQHGTVIKVSRDGSRSQIIANGFRAANGIGIGPHGELAASDQEGFWTPANRINLITKPGGFYGNLWSYQTTKRTKEQGYDPPLCFIPPAVDRSPAEELWVTSDRWGPLKGAMLHTSYGAGKLFLVPYEMLDGVPQGGVVPFDLSFPTGIMRGRFNPGDGQLYVCGLFGWSSNATEPGGLYRVRYTGKPVCLPGGLHVTRDGVSLTFTSPLDRTTAEDVGSYGVQRWNYRWSEKYGSPQYSVANSDKAGQDDVEVTAANLSPDGKTVLLKLADHRPVMQMKIQLNVKAADGAAVKLTVHNTINVLPRK
jgi:glucose/arabinose dehydrogenase